MARFLRPLHTLLAALVVGLLLVVAPLQAADPESISCPNGQTVLLTGQAPPSEALLIFLAERAVGGGLSDAAGTYRLPLRPKERPGSYPVEVRVRATQAVVGRFTCFVDVPLDQAETATPEIVVTAPRTTVATSPTSTRTAATSGPVTTPTLTRTTAAGVTAAPAGPQTATATATGTPPTATATVTGTPPTVTPTVTGTPPTATTTATGQTATTTPTATETEQTGNTTLQIIDVVLIDPAFPDESDEYVSILNASNGDVQLRGWRLVNASRSDVPVYTFPTFTYERDTTIVVYSEASPECEQDLDIGDFCWGRTNGIWRVGDRAELRDAANRLVNSYIVQEQ